MTCTHRRHRAGRLAALLALVLLTLAAGTAGCGFRPSPTPTPTKTPRPTFTVTLPPTATSTFTLVPSPTATPAPSATATATAVPPTNTATLQPLPTETPSPLPATDTPPPPPTATDAPPTGTLIPPTPAPPTATAVPPAPPQQGGEWDLEAGFYEWVSPYEDFVGHIANGWLPLIKVTNPATAPRFNENKFPPNIQSGERSQEISFDYRAGEMGLWRTTSVTPGHRYTVEAWAKYAPSASGLHLFLGIDLTGGSNFEAGSVTWYSWRSAVPDQWLSTTETVQAAGERMTIFLRAVHPVAEVGGNTMFDNVRLIDLGQ